MTQRRKAPGTVSVEMALVAPVLIMLLFGIVELGLMFRNLIAINQVAREGARSASVGAPTGEILDRLASAAATLDQAAITYTLQYRTYSNGTWGAWTTLGNTTEGGMTRNDAPPGSQLRVIVDFSHRLLFTGLFARLADDAENGTMNMRSNLVIRRE